MTSLENGSRWVISGIVTPETIEKRGESFLQVISVGKTPEEKLQLATCHVLEELFQRFEKVSVLGLTSEIIAMLHLAPYDVKNQMKDTFKILTSRTQSFSLFRNLGILDNLTCYSKDIGEKVDLGEYQDSLPLQENLGKILSRLPNTKELVLKADSPVLFGELDKCERGLVGLLLLEERSTVIKWTNSDQESEVAKFCGEKGLSPLVYESKLDCIAEEFITNPRIKSFKDKPEMVGRTIGLMIRKLHDVGVVYDNRFLDHICVEPGSDDMISRVRIIDLESAKFSDNLDIDIKNALSELSMFYKDNKDAFEKANASFSEANCRNY